MRWAEPASEPCILSGFSRISRRQTRHPCRFWSPSRAYDRRNTKYFRPNCLGTPFAPYRAGKHLSYGGFSVLRKASLFAFSIVLISFSSAFAESSKPEEQPGTQKPVTADFSVLLTRS